MTPCLDDGVVGFEDAVRQPTGAQILPDISGRVQPRPARRQRDRHKVVVDVELAGTMPSGVTEQQHGGCAHFEMALGFVDSYRSHRTVAARMTTARKFRAVFSYRVATRRNCLSLEKQHSTRWRSL